MTFELPSGRKITSTTKRRYIVVFNDRVIRHTDSLAKALQVQFWNADSHIFNTITAEAVGG